MLKLIQKTSSILLSVVLTGCTVVSCGSRQETTEVLAIWDMEEDDPSADIWSRYLKKELRSHGIKARLSESYVPHDRTEEFDISKKLDMMEKDGNRAGLIIAGGDMNLHMLYDSPDERLRTIPAVSFGAFFPTAKDRWDHLNISIIKDTVDITRNLELMQILWPETRDVVTEVDWTQSDYDCFLREKIYDAASVLSEDRIINNVKLRYNEKEVGKIRTGHPDAVSLTALSLWDPWVNISTEKKTRIYPQYSFNPEVSRNRVLLYKNDRTTRQMTDDKSFMAFCTAVPQLFEVCDSCAGGFLAPIDVTMRQVAKMASHMLSGNGEELYSIIYPAKDYYLDWNVLRGRYDLKDIPSYIQVRNTTLKDRDADVWGATLFLFGIVIAAIAAIMLTLIFRQSIKGRSIKQAMLDSAREAIRIKDEFDFIRKESNTHIWHLEGDTIISEDPPAEIRPSEFTDEDFDDFYKEKIIDLIGINTPGKHMLQIYGKSPITNDTGWMELRMLVKEGESGLEKTGVTVDINELKTSEAQLIEAHRRLANAQERDNFISSISHEMRTPLNSILGFTQVITDPMMETDEEERAVMRNAVVNYGDELTNIINNILALTRIENGAVQMTGENCSIRNLISDICCEMDVKAESNDITLELKGGPESSLIWTDRLIFKIIVQNVVSNAIKFSNPGGHVYVSWEDTRNGVTVHVVDDGIGIDKNNQSLIFSKFYKVDQFSQGIGLGLAIAWEYITRMGGSITLDSQPGKGSAFHIHFPKTVKEVRP